MKKIKQNETCENWNDIPTPPPMAADTDDETFGDAIADAMDLPMDMIANAMNEAGLVAVEPPPTVKLYTT